MVRCRHRLSPVPAAQAARVGRLIDRLRPVVKPIDLMSRVDRAADHFDRRTHFLLRGSRPSHALGKHRAANDCDKALAGDLDAAIAMLHG